MSKILVVDDEKIISMSLQRVLQRVGHQVLIANNGIEAIHVLDNESKIDIVITDLLMPEVGGAEVLDRAKLKHPQAKVIMMTAYGDLSMREDLLKRGAARVLSKPFDDITKIPALVDDIAKT